MEVALGEGADSFKTTLSRSSSLNGRIQGQLKQNMFRTVMESAGLILFSFLCYFMFQCCTYRFALSSNRLPAAGMTAHTHWS